MLEITETTIVMVSARDPNAKGLIIQSLRPKAIASQWTGSWRSCTEVQA